MSHESPFDEDARGYYEAIENATPEQRLAEFERLRALAREHCCEGECQRAQDLAMSQLFIAQEILDHDYQLRLPGEA